MKRINYKKYGLAAALALLLVAAVAGWLVLLQRMAVGSINSERKQQLEELTVQVSDTFTNALAFNRACAATAANLLDEQSYASKAELVSAMGHIEQLVLTGGDERIFFFVDENGVCYDKGGSKGVWGDFDRIVDMGEDYTFIADSTTYDGTHWAFVHRLAEPITTLDGEVTVRYVVLLKTVEYMSRYYASEAYNEVCETYILKENGTRMYDSVTPEDTISAYNIYKSLRESKSKYGGTLDSVLDALEQNGVACGNYASNGTEYCYSLAWQSEYQFVLLFLIPTDAVAANTVSMIGTMMRVFLAFGMVMLALAILSVVAMQRLANSRRVAALKEKSLYEQEQINRRLEQSNLSLEQSKKATESALDIARSANRAKSSFLSNMSHDIRTPLNAIIGFEKLLEHEADDPAKVREYAGKIEVSSQHLLSLINDILDMSRIESGKTTLSYENFVLKELLDDLVTVVTPQVEARHQSFALHADAAAAYRISADRLRLNQILMNLLSNAIKYTPEGGSISLTVEPLCAPVNGKLTLRFVVADNGVGMSQEFQARIYEPFVREQTSTISGIQGTGLGMSITKNLVDLMGGIITIESELGRGSKFTVELSFAVDTGRPQADAVPTPAPAAAANSALSGVLNGRHFLVAEDNSLNAEIITSLLELENATCDVAPNGQRAVEMFEASVPHTYDAILMDIQMPVMDGYEAARRIRHCTHPEAATIPIAAMTANAFADDVQRALDSGMNAHIAKPIDMEKLREFVSCI